MEYTDELDRMRARNSRKRSGNSAQSQFMEEHQQELEARRARRERQRRRKKRRRRILLFEFLLLVLVLAGAYFFFRIQTATGYWTIAVFGVDSRDGALGRGNRSDVEMICTINRETGEITMVSVYRDTYLKVNSDGDYHKINEAYFEGGPDQAVAALEENLDLTIDNYATFNWKTVAETINILGGIDLEITDKEFKYINSFITETVESTGIGSVHLTSAGMNHLDGVQAVAYARLRLMDTDFNRTQRQRKVVSLAMEKAKQADWAVLNQILVTVLPEISTDVGVDDLIPMARSISQYHIGETTGFPFAKTTAKIDKRDCVIPMTLASNVVQLHQVLYGEETYSPSSNVQKISAYISEKTGIYEEGTPAPSDQPSSGGSTSGDSGSSSGNTPAPTETPAETTPVETVPESETEETSETETLESGETGENGEPDDGDEITGPGVTAPAASEETSGSSGSAPEGNESGADGSNGPGGSSDETGIGQTPGTGPTSDSGAARETEHAEIIAPESVAPEPSSAPSSGDASGGSGDSPFSTALRETTGERIS